MPKIRLLPIYGTDIKTPGFNDPDIERAKKAGTVLVTHREDVVDGVPSWRISFPPALYQWYVYKSEAVVV